jgi:hypothetical protein
VPVDRYVPLQWTEAQKRDLFNYREWQILLMHRASRGMDKHEALTVSRVAPEVIVAVNARGEERTFAPAQTRSFSVHERQPIEVAPGDRLLLTGNRRDADFRATNGELAKVRGVAAIIKVHPKTLQRYARHGIVIGLRVGKLWRFRASDLIPSHLENHGEDLDEDAQAQYAEFNHSCPQPDRR